MTVYAKENPVGIDKQLYKIQVELDKLWDADVYGKLYINTKDGEKIAEAYDGAGYKEVLIDDRKDAVFGFFVSDNRTGLSMIKVTVDLVCSCNLKAIYATDVRKDEEALLAVHKIMERLILLKNEKGIKTGLSNVFSNVSTSRFKYRDMQPWFNFSITFDLAYNNET